MPKKDEKRYKRSKKRLNKALRKFNKSEDRYYNKRSSKEHFVMFIDPEKETLLSRQFDLESQGAPPHFAKIISESEITKKKYIQSLSMNKEYILYLLKNYSNDSNRDHWIYELQQINHELDSMDS